MWGNARTALPDLVDPATPLPIFGILMIASVTFVAYEGFQLVIHAMGEMNAPKKHPTCHLFCGGTGHAHLRGDCHRRGARHSLADIIANQEHALAAGAGDILGPIGTQLVIAGALLATMSAISGTLFGASRLISVIAHDGFFPARFEKRHNGIPRAAVLAMAGFASLLIVIGDLRLILEFGSITFLLVSILMAWANHIHRVKQTPTRDDPACHLRPLRRCALILISKPAHARRTCLCALLYIALSLGAYLYTRLR